MVDSCLASGAPHVPRYTPIQDMVSHIMVGTGNMRMIGNLAGFTE